MCHYQLTRSPHFSSLWFLHISLKTHNFFEAISELVCSANQAILDQTFLIFHEKKNHSQSFSNYYTRKLLVMHAGAAHLFLRTQSLNAVPWAICPSRLPTVRTMSIAVATSYCGASAPEMEGKGREIPNVWFPDRFSLPQTVECGSCHGDRATLDSFGVFDVLSSTFCRLGDYINGWLDWLVALLQPPAAQKTRKRERRHHPSPRPAPMTVKPSRNSSEPAFLVTARVHVGRAGGRKQPARLRVPAYGFGPYNETDRH